MKEKVFRKAKINNIIVLTTTMNPILVNSSFGAVDYYYNTEVYKETSSGNIPMETHNYISKKEAETGHEHIVARLEARYVGHKKVKKD